MDFCESLNKYYADLISAHVEETVYAIIEEVICEIKKMDRNSGSMLSGDDSDLKNLWDEICVQVQCEPSVYWDAYNDFLNQCIQRILKESCNETEMRMIWLQTEGFDEWYFHATDDEDNDSEACNPIIDGGNVDDTVNYIKEKVLTRAGSYSNKQIQEYIDQYF